MLAARYARSCDIAVIIVVARWHPAGAGSELLPDRPLYPSFPVQLALWLVIAVAITAGAARLLRSRSGAAGAYALAAVALAITLAGAADCPAGQLLKVDWAWGTAGWLGVLVLLRRPLAELLALLALEALATFTVLSLHGLHRADIAGFITILAESTTIQLVVAVDIETIGALPGVPAEVRRVITDTAIAILTTPASHVGSP